MEFFEDRITAGEALADRSKVTIPSWVFVLPQYRGIQMDLIVHNWTEAGFSTHETWEYDPLVGRFEFFCFWSGVHETYLQGRFPNRLYLVFFCVRLLVFLLFYF